MTPPAGDGASPAPIDRPILEFLQRRLDTTAQVANATITDASGHLELRVELAAGYYPATVDEAVLAVRWYTNDDFTVQYRDARGGREWVYRWDRHPNPHNTRAHFHPPPDAPTPGEDASWPSDHRDVMALVLEAIERRIATLWET